MSQDEKPPPYAPEYGAPQGPAYGGQYQYPPPQGQYPGPPYPGQYPPPGPPQRQYSLPPGHYPPPPGPGHQGYPMQYGAPPLAQKSVSCPCPEAHTGYASAQHGYAAVTQPMLAQGSSGAITQTVIIQTPTRPASYMWLSCLVFLCCNMILGVIAFGLACASSRAADQHMPEQARSYGRSSLYVSISGILLTLTLILLMIVLYLTVDMDEIEDLEYETGYK